ncbi:DUF4349 domain-containing protein [Alkalibacillus silvisoli]|uniref:DUF4349 domain-containing protein n=1 Tax=Alkalibacillus silvisoli TaxID=392823 RepID=A0ABN1A984_9BACI
MVTKSKWKIFILTLWFIVFVTVLYACSNDDEVETTQESYDLNADEDAGFTEEQATTEEVEQAELRNESEPQLSEDRAESRMVIYSGRLAIEVPDFDDSERELTKEIEARDGYIVESSSYEHEEGLVSGSIVARIPDDYFHDFMNNIEGEHTNVTEKSIQGQDVTEEYVDLESRLLSKEAVEERLLNFLDEAEDTEDLLNISNDLSGVQEEIEQIKGRMGYLENHSAYSTVHIDISEQRVNVPEIENQDSLNTIERAQQLLMNTVNFIINIFSGITVLVIGLSPVLIPLTVIALIFYIKYRRNKG